GGEYTAVGTITVANQAGTISGSLSGLFLRHGFGAAVTESARVINTGMIAGTDSELGVGIISGVDGTIDNSGMVVGATGIIGYTVSRTGIRRDASLTITNTGTISGGASNGMAIAFGLKKDRLILDKGSVLDGDVSGGGGDDELDLMGMETEDSSFVGF